ncbi:S8 family serine peptidase [Stagnihabitans tardus]|uniref:S8 family serine peptidase n=1 Tax=Stagnihabitans tardus TaxID=2699202 RepID=A0AAE4YE63_9RHOB|nr:S8 family serine peptidase [Stagnihabitans tardus]NBZ88020.1 S8 family serine peptidase [Stagnihabitans tardus]
MPYPLGPHERWLFGPGKHYDLPGLWLDTQPSLSCLAEFPNPVGNPLTAVANLLNHDGITMQPRFPTLWSAGGFRPHFLPLLLTPQGQTALEEHNPSRLAELLGRLPREGARHLRLNFPVRSETLNAKPQPPTAATPSQPPGAPLSVLAVIDHGIAFADRRLRAGGQTRMDYCWSQSALSREGETVLFGREFTREQIDAGDAEALYREAGLLGGANRPPMPLARRVAHGTHVLGTAAQGPGNVRLIGVDLPATALWDTSGFGTDMFLLAAVHYVFDRADRIAAAHGLTHVPVVLNISLGWSGGPHDGTSPIEAALAEIIEARRTLAPTLLVLPSGNMFTDQLAARIEDRHFVDGQAALRWFAPPCDMTSSFAEVWLPGGPQGYEVSLTAPDGTVTTLAAPGWQDVTVAGRTVGLAMLDCPRGTRWRASFCLAPTEAKALPPMPHGPAPAGEWRIAVRRPATATGVVQIRIQRDEDQPQGRTGARQSRLLDPCYEPYDATGAPGQKDNGSMLCRMDGLNGLATQAVSLNVGGSIDSLARPSRYSSAGVGRGVDVSATADRGVARPGVLSWTAQGAGVVAQSGTSSAAPKVAAALALALLTEVPAGNGADLLTGAPVPPDLVDRLGQLRL